MKMRITHWGAGAVLLSLMLSACENDSPDDLEDPSVVDHPTYTANIRQIIDNNCTECHAATPVNDAPMPLVTYDNVRDAVLNRGLLDRISRPQGADGMMPNGGTRLPQSQINLIVLWSEQGLQE